MLRLTNTIKLFKYKIWLRVAKHPWTKNWTKSGTHLPKFKNLQLSFYNNLLSDP